MPKKTKVQPLLHKTYLAVIENSVGSFSFRNFYAKVNGKEKDILADGDLSCAFFVSAILKSFDLVKQVHTTVDGTVKDFASKHAKAMKPKPGDVLVWEAKNFDSGPHKHIGFYLNPKVAVSTSDKKRCVVKHNPNFENRKIIAIYRPKFHA